LLTKRIIFDNDGGVDDLLALSLLLNFRFAGIRAVTTVGGNIPANQAAHKCMELLEIANIEGLEVAVGRNDPLVLAPHHIHDVHGFESHEGFPCDLSALSKLTAEELIADGFNRSQNVLATGPLTNIAEAITKFDLEGVQNLTIMGGVFGEHGNISSCSEYNFFVDPHAAEVVFRRVKSCVVVPLDLCRKVILPAVAGSKKHHFSEDALSCHLRSILSAYMSVCKSIDNIDGCYPHDAIAAAAIFKPDLFIFERGVIHIATGGDENRGASSFTSDSQGNVMLARDVDSDVLLDWINQVVFPNESVTKIAL